MFKIFSLVKSVSAMLSCMLSYAICVGGIACPPPRLTSEKGNISKFIVARQMHREGEKIYIYITIIMTIIIYTRTHIYTYMYIHIHIHTHTQIQPVLQIYTIYIVYIPM
jgi:hypothetical protein